MRLHHRYIQKNIGPKTCSQLQVIHPIQPWWRLFSVIPIAFVPFSPSWVTVSQAAACDGMIYSVNYNGQNSVTQGYSLPLFED